MSDNDYDTEAERRPARRAGFAVKVGLVGAGLAAGVIGATAIGASATTTGSGSTGTSSATATTSTQTPSNSSGRPAGAPPAGRRGSGPVRSDEKAVSTAIAATLKAAALNAVPGGTVYRIETDAGDGVYEAHMTKADGTEVTVKFDKNLAVIKVEDGMGQGDPRPANGH